MSRMEKKIRRAQELASRRAERKHYRENRDIGSCFLQEDKEVNCQNNGDTTTHCRFCDFKVQACTLHWEAGRNKAKRHLMLKHPAKTLPTLVMGVLRGQPLD